MMDSVLEEDVTLRGMLSDRSGFVPNIPDNLDGIDPTAGLGNGVLPNVSEEMVSPTRARNMKDFENNIELKVEVESLKRELQEREQLLIKASKAVESLAEGGGSEIQRVKEDAQKKVQQVEDLLSKKICLLEEDVKAAQAELEKACAGTETEMALRLSLESKLSEMKNMHTGDLEMALVLEEKDRLIEELKLSLKSKEALIQCLKEEKSQVAFPDESVSSGELRGLSAALREEKDRETEVAQMEHQKERNHSEEKIQALQEDLREKEREIATEKKNSLKRDKAIQGLTVALKSKEKEVEELKTEIGKLNIAIAEAKEVPQRVQTQKSQGSEDPEAALLEKTALLAELQSENFNKSTENHKLRRNIKKVTQELSDLQQERQRLEKDLEVAHREKSKGDASIHDLRIEVEKLRNEVNEREKVVENRYKNLLSESNKKLHSQEQIIRRLTESAGQKDALLQKFNEQDLEAVQQHHYLMTAEDLGFRSEDLITEKCSSQQSPGSKIIFSEEKQQLDYEELIQVLKKERDIYTHLVKSLQDSDSLKNQQTELNNILALRKQLEKDVLSYQNLKKTLEEQISEIRRREEEPFSFYSDQTSYLSICLEEHSRLEVEHFSQEELKKKVSDLIQLVKDLYTDNQHLKKTIFDVSTIGFWGDNRLASIQQKELLTSKEDEDTTGSREDDSSFQSDQRLEQGNKIKKDHPKGNCKNGYLKHMDSNISEHDEPSCLGDQNLEESELMTLLAPFFNEKATLLLESRPDLLKVLRELLLGRICLTEQDVSGEHLDGKAEKTLKQIAVQLRGELGYFIHTNSFSKLPDEQKLLWGTQLPKAGEASKVELKDASVQTVAMASDSVRFKHDSRGEAWDDKPTDAAVCPEHQPENLCRMPGLQATPLSPHSRTSRDAKKSRLPILLKPSQSAGSMHRLPATQEVEVQLQGQILELQGDLEELKIHNKQLQQKLILAETMMGGRPTPDKTQLNVQPLVRTAYQDSPEEQKRTKTTPCAWKDKEGDNGQQTSYETDFEIYQPDDHVILPRCKENLHDLLEPTSVATQLSSKSHLSTKINGIETDQSENIDTSDETENLKQKICDLETKLAVYQNVLLQLQKHSQFSEAVITVLCGTEGAQDGLNKPKSNTDEEEMTFSSLHQVRYVKHTKILHPLAPDMLNDRMLESLNQQLLEKESELQKEQDLNVELFSEICNLQNKFRDVSPSRYDSLVQSQARELSLQRQQIKDSHDICVIYRQHMNSVIKTFEELLQASDVDYYVAKGFQEQLNQCAKLLKKLEKLFLNGKSVEVEMSTQNELIERVEEDNLTYQYILPESPGPSVSHALSDYEISEKSSSSRDQKPDETEKPSATANAFSQDVLMEHIQEIRSLRKRLEESIKTNEQLRRQLERQGSEFDQGSTNMFACGSELHNSLTSEIHFLRNQNKALNIMLAKGSRDKQKENEKLREALSRKTANLEHLQQEFACMKGENERLQNEVGKKEKHNQQLLQELCHSHSELSRVQEEVKTRQQLLSQNDKLLQSLRVELKVYEKLDEDHRKPRGARTEAAGEGWRGQDTFGDLHDLLTEIQALRTQLEKSIETNSTLQSKLEKQLERAEKSPETALTSALQTLSIPERPFRLDRNDGDNTPMLIDNSDDLFDSTLTVSPRSAAGTPPLSENNTETLSCNSGSLTVRTLCVSRPWASKCGRHILGLIEDYDALCKQIGQGQRLLDEMDCQVLEAPNPMSQELGTKGPHSASLSRLIASVSATKLILEEAARLLTLLWRVSLPDGQCMHHCEQTGEMKAEITKLRKKLFEQEKKLQNTEKLLQLSKHQEKVIFDQLVVTHKILRKARGNLELRPGVAHAGTSSPSRPGS
ncbi:CDK5 regulatory subunit-associated protein 2 isoform X2 [Erinaceus europaeus]|uniref:CDK5 regulatory subunit-associated protein 2 isoform X2 n=1 Tax=Erinaceus europaeus TaxID=9365 RepID=A0ABM3Y4P8_ERIEU|nr:CDK5 regulatory subunit-associated protein 2 isoform X2 [Erinaceus europaeus]